MAQVQKTHAYAWLEEPETAEFAILDENNEPTGQTEIRETGYIIQSVPCADGLTHEVLIQPTLSDFARCANVQAFYDQFGQPA